jgi:hypothetical protein
MTPPNQGRLGRLFGRRDATPATAPAAPPPPVDALAYGLVPEEQLRTDRSAPDPELDAVLAATARGEWQAAADLLAGTPDPDLRWMRIGPLASAAAEEDHWLLAWEAARPSDPTAALLRADSTNVLAGMVRGGKKAKYTTSEQFEGFARLQERALAEFDEAVRLAPPEDPNPYVGLISIAYGQGWPHERMHALWAEITRRAPHHFAAHTYALQYWCAKWRGSEELVTAFAEQAAAAAPPGALLSVLRLHAIFENIGGMRSKDPRHHSPETLAAVDAVLADIAAAPPGHHRLHQARHITAWFQLAAGRHSEALGLFRLADGYTSALPWFWYQPDRYVKNRAAAVRGWERAGRPAAGAGTAPPLAPRPGA